MTRTPSQQRKIDGIRRTIERTMNSYLDENHYEIKEWTETDYDHFVAIWAVVGLKNDEETLAEALCRDKWQIFVGRKGGVRQVVEGKKRHQTGFSYWRKSYK